MGFMKKNIKTKTKILISSFFVFLLALSMSSQNALSMSNEDCLECHGDEDLTREEDDSSIYVNAYSLAQSVHGEEECITCHQDADVEDEHPVKLAKVSCEECHEDVGEIYENSMHGQARKRDDDLAPHCFSCHGTHNILPSSDPKSNTYALNIPVTCGKCHQEGTPMTKTHVIGQHNVLENYSMSIHGRGLLKNGLIVSAVCTSCHTSHNLLPHTDPASSIHRDNVAVTCMQCHVNIEQTHSKVIRGVLWEKEPHKIPSCVECHQPHVQRQVTYEDSLPDSYCMECHGNPDLAKTDDQGGAQSLYVDLAEFDEFKGTLHKKEGLACVKCHTNMDTTGTKDVVCQDSGPVDCSSCHADQNRLYAESIHGKLLAKKDANAPNCTDCHGKHANMSKYNADSPTNPRNVPKLCGSCHQEGKKAAIRKKGGEHHILSTFSMSTHGKGLEKSGLLVSATCTSCHTAHSILEASDPDSTVNRDHVSGTCATCHFGVAMQFEGSVHSLQVAGDNKEVPVCNDCHSSHGITRIDQSFFRNHILDQCGDCHAQESHSYLNSYHGKASMLAGGERVAKCSDCHGAHNIFANANPKSTLHKDNAVKTCSKCHLGANLNFTGYLTHASHHDKERHPELFYTFWIMTTLLSVTFFIFGLHTLLWFPRSLKERLKKRKAARKKKE